MFILNLREVRQNNSDNYKWLKVNLRFRTTGVMKITEILSDFIYESNRVKRILFVASLENALKILA